MKKILLSLIFLSVSISGFSQISFNNAEGSPIQFIEKQSAATNLLTGSPYLEDEFTPGRIVENDKRSPNFYFRYNAAQDQIEIKVDPNEEKIYILPRLSKFSFELKDYTYILEQYRTLEGELLHGYLMSFYKGDRVVFIGKPVAKVISAQQAQTSYGKDKPARIKIDLKYYLGVNGENFSEVRLKEKDLKKLLGNSPEMKEYFSGNKIKEMEDVLKMLQYYDSIK